MKRFIYRYKNSAYISFILGLFLGLLSFILIYGTFVINPTHVDWLMDTSQLEGSMDLTQHYLGWVFYRKSPWTFPVGMTKGIYSSPVSVIYTDSIPLFAFFFKILSPLLPANFQYMGIYGLISYMLMGGFGCLITRKFSSNIIINFSGSLFFILSPILLNRMFLHTALAAHFIFLAAFCLWIYRDIFTRRKYVFLWCLLTTSATLINAYFTPMVLGILLFSLIQEIIAGSTVKIIFPSLSFPIVTTLIGCIAMGMFSGDTNASGSGGLDYLSFNLDGFFNPFTYMTAFGHGEAEHLYHEYNYSRFLPNLPLTTPFQNEGFSYLGLGIIILIIPAAISLILILKKNRLTLSYFVSVLLCGLVFLYLALSPQWTFGMINILRIPYPNFIRHILSIFRSTARFIWPVYYMIYSACFILPLIAINQTSRKDESKSLYKLIFSFIMIGCLFIQIIDLSNSMFDKRHTFKTASKYTYASPMQSDAWNTILKNKEKIMVYCPTSNLYLDNPCALAIEALAEKNNMTMNMTYMSRDLTSYADQDVKKHFKSLAQNKKHPEYVYFFVGIDRNDLPQASTYHLQYYELDGFIVATNI